MVYTSTSCIFYVFLRSKSRSCETGSVSELSKNDTVLTEWHFVLNSQHFNWIRRSKTVPPIYFRVVKKKSIRFHLVTARKWGGITRETEQYQYLRSASLIPSKQAVIGMFAVIFHVGLLISPPHTRIPSLCRPDHFIETSQRCPWCGCQKGKLFAIHVRKWLQTCASETQENRLKWRLFFFSPYLRFDTVTRPFLEENNPIIYSDWGKSERWRGVGCACRQVGGLEKGVRLTSSWSEKGKRNSN